MPRVNGRPSRKDFASFNIFRSYKNHRLNGALDFSVLSSSEVSKIFVPISKDIPSQGNTGTFRFFADFQPAKH